MHTRSLQIAALALAALGLTAFTFGGWAVITVDDLPQSLTVGQPVSIAFTVRQHGVSLLNRLDPQIVATEENGGGGDVTVAAKASEGAGHYAARLIVPRPGKWIITINSGFMNSRIALLPLSAVWPGTRAPAPERPADVGRRLFVAKGCVGCHVHGAVPGYPEMRVGPELTSKRYVADYLARLLADPSVARTPGTQNIMPNLGLKTSEIASLVSFLNADRQVSARP